MATLKDLDDRVLSELKGMKFEGLLVEFNHFRVPGCGYFEISGTINSVAFEYVREAGHIGLTLNNGRDVINVYSDGKIVWGVYLNDTYHHNPEAPRCGVPREAWRGFTDREDEAMDVVERGKKALADVHDYLRTAFPGAVQLMEGYFSRSLLPLDDRIDLRTNAEIFAGFDLKPKKT